MPNRARSTGMAVQHGGTSVEADHLLAWMSDFQGCGQMTGAAAEVSPQAAPDGAATAQLGQAPGHARCSNASPA